MSKQEFLDILEEKLSAKVNREETASLVQYYDGYIDEALDFGMSESEIIEQLGDLDLLVDEITQGLSQENIDISTREIAVTTNNLEGLEMDLRNTSVEVVYDDTISGISVKVDKRFKQDYLVKTIDGVFKIKQIKSSISVGPGFVVRYNRGEDKRLFDFDFNFDLEIKSRKLYVRIPTSYDLETSIVTTNAKIDISEGNDKVQTAPVRLATTCSSITVNNMKIRDLHLKTTNAVIRLNNVDSDVLEAITSNAKIVMEDVLAKQLKVHTTNAKIQLDDVLFLEGRIKTTNAKISCALRNNDLAKRVRYKTSNSKVVIDGVRYDNRGELDFNDQGELMKLDVQTTNAKIELENFR